LSGGEKNVLSLAKALLKDPKFLILDEPGNHLDFQGLAWLEEFLISFNGAVLIVSHNRHTLDRVATGILTLEDGKVSRYVGGYSNYRATRLRELLAQQADYSANQKRLAQLRSIGEAIGTHGACSCQQRGGQTAAVSMFSIGYRREASGRQTSVGSFGNWCGVRWRQDAGEYCSASTRVFEAIRR
jgi:ATPase subunit of ABC transporter with duplicated ATPase domains